MKMMKRMTIIKCRVYFFLVSPLFILMVIWLPILGCLIAKFVLLICELSSSFHVIGVEMGIQEIVQQVILESKRHMLLMDNSGGDPQEGSSTNPQGGGGGKRAASAAGFSDSNEPNKAIKSESDSSAPVPQPSNPDSHLLPLNERDGTCLDNINGIMAICDTDREVDEYFTIKRASINVEAWLDTNEALRSGASQSEISEISAARDNLLSELAEQRKEVEEELAAEAESSQSSELSSEYSSEVEEAAPAAPAAAEAATTDRDAPGSTDPDAPAAPTARNSSVESDHSNE